MDQYLLLGMLAVFVGLLFVQSRNRKKQAAALQENLKPGSEVMLTSGIIGTVEAVAGDRIVIVTAGTTKIEVASGAVLRVIKTETAPAAAASNAAKRASRAVAAKKAPTAPKAKSAPKKVK